MQNRLDIAYREVHVVFPAELSGDVDRGQWHVEREVKCLLVSRLAVAQPRELFSVTVQELDLEPGAVEVEDVDSLHALVCAEKDLAGLRLLLRISEVGDDDPDLAPEAHRPDHGGVQSDLLQTGGDEHGLVRRLQVDIAGELPRTSSPACLRVRRQVLHAHVIPEAADDLESESPGPGHEYLLGEEGIRDKTAGELERLILERVYRSSDICL